MVTIYENALNQPMTEEDIKKMKEALEKAPVETETTDGPVESRPM